jgi:hypothetical protein
MRGGIAGLGRGARFVLCRFSLQESIRRFESLGWHRRGGGNVFRACEAMGLPASRGLGAIRL